MTSSEALQKSPHETARAVLGALLLVVEHRAPEAGFTGGPSLRVRDAQSGREWLRFDCFERDAHWHLDPKGQEEFALFTRGSDAVSEAFALLRERGAELLARAGASHAPTPEEWARALAGLEPALRNGPPRFDALDEAVLRTRSGEKWQRYAGDVLPLWVADMDFEVADPIRHRLVRAQSSGDHGYPLYPEPTPLPALFAERMAQRFGWTVDPRRVELCTEVVQALHIAVQQFSAPGEGVLVQPPIYPPFLQTVGDLQRRLVANPLAPCADGYELDLDDLRARAKDARILMFCNPHNPSGHVFTRAELEALAEVVLERDLLLLSDEIHADLVYPGRTHIPIASLAPEIAARCITLYSASKAFNIAGLRCAAAHFGSESVQREFCAQPQHLRGGLGAPGLMATEAAWRHAQPWLDAALLYLRANRDFVVNFVRDELPGLRCAAPEATYLAWLDCRDAELKDPARFFLTHARVALSAGVRFGPEGEGFARLNFATSRALLTQALTRMAQALRERGAS